MKTTTYGIKRALSTGAISIFTTTNEWESQKYIGPGASFSGKEWKTRTGAQKNAERHGADVFEWEGGI